MTAFWWTRRLGVLMSVAVVVVVVVAVASGEAALPAEPAEPFASGVQLGAALGEA